MSFGTQILDKSDLNSYKEPGNYYCSGSLAAQQLINSPTKNAFVMKVELGTGINYPTQTITSFGDGKKYFRVYIPENTEWRNWVEYVTNTDLFSVHFIAQTLNGYVEYFDARIKSDMNCVASIKYSSVVLNYILNVQVHNGSLIIYVRTPEGTIPQDNTNINIYAIFAK